MDAGIISLKANDAWLSHARRSALCASSTRKQRRSQKPAFRNNNNNNTLRCKIAGFESSVTSSPPAEIGHQIQRIPEVLLSPNVPDPKNVAAFILGGGTGSRLFPLTKTRAVPAVPIAGGYKIVDVPMSNCINSGINKIYILTQFNSTSLNRHISRTFGDVANFGGGFAEVLAATQSPGETGMNWFQGTADAIRQFAWVFDDRRNQHIEHVLILSGDQIYRMNYMELIEKHVETGADITISCIPIDASRASEYGLVRVDKNGRITEFQEKPRGGDLEAMKDDGSFHRLSHQDTKKYPYIASMGIYVFDRKALQQQFMIRDGRANDFGQHILPFAVNYFNVQAYMFQDYWEDIGTIKAFYEANLALTEQPPKFQFYDQRTPMYTSPRYLPPTTIDKSKMRSSIISHGCFLYKCGIERSIIGVRSRISAGAEIKNTLMFGANIYETEEQIASLLEKGMVPIGVGQNTKIRNCIIDTNARIGQNVVIANKDGVEEADRSSEGFYVRSGITIILRSATIKDGTVI